MAESSARIRRHPFLATGLAALLGYVGGPRVLRGLGRMLQGGSSLRAVAEFVGAIERRMAG